MKFLVLKSATAAVALLSLTGIAAAQEAAIATADLNLRSGPGSGYSVIGVIPASEQATIIGCIDGSSWCQVTYAGVEGWAYSGYLATLSGEEQNAVVLSERPPETVPMVTYESTTSIGTVEVVPPPREVTTYVEENPIGPVYLEGEVTVGTSLPETVEIREIPEYEYRYVYVNGQPVLVEPESRRIVYVMR